MPRTLKYFHEHSEEATKVAAKCKELEKNDLSTMTLQQRMEWSDTPIGIDCRNAQQAVGDNKWRDYQERLRKSAETLK